MDDTILESLYKSVLKFLAPLTPEETYATVVNEAVKLVSGDDGMIMLEKNGEFERVYSSAKVHDDIQPRKNGFTYEAYKEKKAFVTNSKDFRKLYPQLLEIGIYSTLFIPLSYKNKSFGVLIVRSFQDNKEFSYKELNTLKLFGSLASLAIRKMQLYDETKKALDMRNQFISLAAHELRTPLTSIHGYLQLLQKKHTKKQSSEDEWIEDMYSESMKLMNLINELLEVNHLETGKVMYHFSEVNIVSIVSKTIAKISNAYPKHTVKFTTSKKSMYVIGDEEKLQQVFFSLLDNAAKFSSSRYEITVSLVMKDHQITISIQDKGRGIRKEDIPHIFEGFYKGVDNNIVGMGLGLLLSQNVVKKHHGKIIIQSKEKKGTKVTVKLPEAVYE